VVSKAKQNADQLNHAHSEAVLSGWKASIVAAKSGADKRRKCLIEYGGQNSWERQVQVSLPTEGGGGVMLSGLGFSREAPHAVYVEGMLQAAAAYEVIGQPKAARKWMRRSEGLRSRSGGVFYSVGASHQDFRRRPAVAATCRYRFNEATPPLNPLAPPAGTAGAPLAGVPRPSE